jgi:hypothetical protein
MVDAFRNMLDELMGKERDVPLDKRQNKPLEFDDPAVCKYELVALCPNRLFRNTKSDLGERCRAAGATAGRQLPPTQQHSTCRALLLLLLLLAVFMHYSDNPPCDPQAAAALPYTMTIWSG